MYTEVNIYILIAQFLFKHIITDMTFQVVDETFYERACKFLSNGFYVKYPRSDKEKNKRPILIKKCINYCISKYLGRRLT